MVDIVSIIMEASATDLNARIAERVRELRAQRGLSLDALANVEINRRVAEVYAGLPKFALGRFGETTARTDEVV